MSHKSYMMAFAMSTPGMLEVSLMHALDDEYYMSEVCGVSVPSDSPEMSGTSEMPEVPAVRAYELMCAACGIRPSESRDVSVFALCDECCDSLKERYLSDSFGKPGSSDMSDADRMTWVWREMHGRFGYAMMDAALDELFD